MRLRLENIILFLLFCSVLGSGIGYSKLWLYHIVLLVFLLVFFILSLQGRLKILKNPNSIHLRIFELFVFWYLLSILWANNIYYSIQYFIIILLGGVLVFLIPAYAVRLDLYKKTFNILKIAFGLAIVVGLLEATTSFRLPTSPYSDYAHIFGRKETDFSLFSSDAGLYIGSMPTSFWGNPNTFAVAMGITLPFFLNHSNFWFRYLGSIAIFFLIFMAGSRGVFIAGIVGLFFNLFLFRFKYFLFLSLLCSIGYPVLYFLYNVALDSDNMRIVEMASLGDLVFAYLFEQSDLMNSAGVRQELIRNGIDALWGTYGLGVGGGGSRAIQEAFGGVAGKITSMHNFWAEILVDGGVIGFSLFSIFFISTCLSLFRIHRFSHFHEHKSIARNLLVSLVIFSIGCISASSVIYFLPMWILFGLAIALISIDGRAKA